MFSTLYNEIFFKPIANFVLYVYNHMPEPLMNLAVAIVLVLMVVRIILLPLTIGETRTRKIMKHLQDSGEMKALDEHKSNPQVYFAKMKELYQKYDLKPFRSTFVSLLIQLPIFFALYKVFIMIVNKQSFAAFLYVGNSAPENFVTTVFNIDLAVPNLVLAFIVAAVQYLFMAYGPMAVKNNGKALAKTENGTAPDMNAVMAQKMNGVFKYFFPGLMLLIGVTLPAGITFYIICSVLINWVVLLVLDKYIAKKNKAKYGI
ncbi:MAG TPA: membrane protein insertase YidC [bacterium]|nr:membrane protein insertase YidC [bacterium]